LGGVLAEHGLDDLGDDSHDGSSARGRCGRPVDVGFEPKYRDPKHSQNCTDDRPATKQRHTGDLPAIMVVRTVCVFLALAATCVDLRRFAFGDYLPRRDHPSRCADLAASAFWYGRCSATTARPLPL
jgi:hypothetical protein